MKSPPVTQRVAVISQLPPPTHGSTVMTGVFLETLETLGYRCCLIDRRFSTTIDQVGKPSLRKVVQVIGLCRRLVLTIWRQRPDKCVLFATTRRGSLMVDWLLAEVLVIFHVPVIAYLHTTGYRKLAQESAIWSWVVKRFFSRFTDIVLLSPMLAPDIYGIAPLAPRYAIENTVAEEAFNREFRREVPSRKHVVFVSNLIPDKGAKDFIAIANRVLESMDVSFSLIGAPTDRMYSDELDSLITELGIQDNVKVLGPVYGEAKWRLLGSAAALVFPSTYEYEAQPLTIIESMHVGTPVLAYGVGAIADCVVTGTTGWVADPGRVDELAEHLISLLDDDAAWLSMSRNSQDVYRTRFSHAAYERKWHQVLS